MYKRGIEARKAQITIFVVIALVIISAIAVVFIIRNRLVSEGPEGVRPSQISLQFENGIKECVKENSKQAIEVLSEKAGHDDLSSVQYDGLGYTYLCYTGLNYEPCINQDPFLKETFERGIEESLEKEVEDCSAEILDNARAQGYEVDSSMGKANVNIKPERVEVSYLKTITITKGKDKFVFNRFDVQLASNLNLFLEITENILNDEAKFGNYDKQTTMLLDSERTLEIKSFNLGNPSGDSTLYTINKNGEEFKFAVRSYALPAGLY